MSSARKKLRHLVVVLGDQLDLSASTLAEFDKERDLIWMAEAAGEAGHVWSTRMRIAYFFSAMRHFREALKAEGLPVHYHEIDDSERGLMDLLQDTLEDLQPEKVICTLPGEWRVLEELRQACKEASCPLEVREDSHFMDVPEAFRDWAEGRKAIRLEYYYREMRKRHQILMTEDGKPEGGEWNFDKENRGSFGKDGPAKDKPVPPSFAADAITREVVRLVNERFSDHPGSLDDFRWPVTREDALTALEDFVKNRLPEFGLYQDAMWTGEPWLYHSLLSPALNAKLLNPREVIKAATDAYQAGGAPLNAVEGFVRQILGWREYVRGVYWWKMPGYLELNALQAEARLPEFYWTGETRYRCLSESLQQTLEHGYAHHIQRLMVTGLYGLLLGIDPVEMHKWYLAVYVDAVEWVELPNTLGMSQFADEGIMASKPYVASGKYIQRMSNYCSGCPANPAKATGEDACPFTTLYWDFLYRHREDLSSNRRMQMQLRNLERKSEDEMAAIREAAKLAWANPSGMEVPA
ncbi:MAG: cryptochrome/photolyase family protein [Puniceicoccaceae bacterium]